MTEISLSRVAETRAEVVDKVGVVRGSAQNRPYQDIIVIFFVFASHRRILSYVSKRKHT
jgi:hypothetical protein